MSIFLYFRNINVIRRLGSSNKFHCKYTTFINNRMVSNCVFCKIVQNEIASEKTFENDELCVFKDIKPATKFHYLAVPKEHIINVNSLSSPEHKGLLQRLIESGKKVVEEQGGDINDIRLGFHLPPFNSISHLHLHIICPASEMSLIGRMIFKPNSWWFATADQILAKLETQKNVIGNKL